MDRRGFLRGAGVAALSGCLENAAAPSKPNLLFILADQWRGQALSGIDSSIKTPNLDKLSATGIRFPRAYASIPVCSPSRAALFTGRFAHMSGVLKNSIRLPLSERCLAAELYKAGYSTGFIGKWHLDGEEKPGFVPPGPRRGGFTYWAAFNCGHEYFDSVYFRDENKPIHGRGFEPDYQTDLAIDFVRANASRPFFLCVSWGPPHPPRTPPSSYATLYEARKMPLRANVPAGFVDKTQEALAGCYGLCSVLDRNVGRLLDVLSDKGLADNTIVVFTSDHGDTIGSHGLDVAESPYEESVLVPLFIRYPRALKGGQVNSMLVSNVDLMPTLLSMLAVPVPPDVQGRDLASQILSGDGPPSESVYCQGQLGTPNEWRLVVRGLDKIVVDRELKVTHHYNLGQDPYELENLVSESAHSVRSDEMSALMRDWMQRVQDGILPSGLKLRR